MDPRERVFEAVMAWVSRREAAERFEISASSAVKWLHRFDETGSIARRFLPRDIDPSIESMPQDSLNLSKLGIVDSTQQRYALISLVGALTGTFATISAKSGL